MGLAASQARFLAITARKADCEFRSMQIAQNKLSVTREMELATQDYQNAINATKMVWDYDGEQSFMTDISYGLLMTPSYLNNFNPYLITNRGGQVIVDSKIAAAAERVGIDPKNGANRSADGFADFLWALGYTVGAVSTGTVEDVGRYVHSGLPWGNESFERYYVDNVGYPNAGKYVYLQTDNDGNYKTDATGKPIIDKTKGDNGVKIVNASIGDGHFIYIDKNGNSFSKYDKDAGYGSMPMSKNEYIDVGISGLIQKLQKSNSNTKMEGDKVSGYASGTDYLVNGASHSSITLADVLTSKVVLVATTADGDFEYGNDVGSGDDDSIHEDVSTFFKDGANAICKTLYGVNIDDADAPKAFVTAYNYVANMYGIMPGKINRGTLETVGSGDKSVGDAKNEAKGGADRLNKIVYFKQTGNNKKNSVAAVNLSNMFGYFLTLFDNIASGWDTNYKVDTDPSRCAFVTQDPDFRFAVLSEDTETNETVMKSDFYMQLYNNLCVNGYVVDKNIKDNKHLEQMLENGSYYLCGVNKYDGYFYQARYSDDVRTLIKVVNDEDAKTQAESEYNYRKMRLTAKEDRLDLEMKNIDMEIASLTAEYDSVKNLISKSVEKTFKQFES